MGGFPNPSHSDGNTTTICSGVDVRNTRTAAVNHWDARRREKPIKLLPVSLFCLPEEPVRSAQFFGQAQRHGDVLTGDGTNRVHDQSSCRVDPQFGAHAHSIASRLVGLERVIDRDGFDSAIGHLELRHFVDRDVAPRITAQWQLVDVRKAVALPGWVVVMHDRRPVDQITTDGSTRGEIQRNRAEVLHDNQIDAVEHRCEVGLRRRFCCIDRQSRNAMIDRTLASNGHNVVAKLAQRECPAVGDDAHTVRETQPEKTTTRTFS